MMGLPPSVTIRTPPSPLRAQIGPTSSQYQASECQWDPNFFQKRPTGIVSQPSTFLLGAIGSMMSSPMTMSDASRFSSAEYPPSMIPRRGPKTSSYQASSG